MAQVCEEYCIEMREIVVKKKPACWLFVAVCVCLSASARGEGIRVIDKEVRYGTKVYAEGEKPRPAPEMEVERLAITALPAKIKSPGGWEENVYSTSGEQTTLRAAGKDWIVHLVETTRGVDDTNTGAQDYKVWYRVSRDLGKSYSELKPLERV